jgi:hypothetical protein
MRKGYIQLVYIHKFDLVHPHKVDTLLVVILEFHHKFPKGLVYR